MKFILILAMVVCMSVGAVERWTIANQAAFAQVLFKHGIEPQTAVEALEKNGIRELQFGPCERTVPDKKWAQIQAGQDRTADQIAILGEGVFLSMPKHARVPHNIVVELDTKGDAITEGQRLALRAAANQVHAIMKQEFGLTHVVESHYKEGTFERIEFIPSQKAAGSSLDLADKLDSIVRVVFRDAFAFYYPPITEEERLLEIESWRQALVNSTIQAIIPSNKEPENYREWTQVETNRLLGRDILLDRIHAMLDREGVFVHREVLACEEEKENERASPKKGCAFCVPKIITNQRVYEGERCNLLFNFCPAPGEPRAHYLIIPKRHVSDITSVNSDEELEMHRLAEAVKAVIGDKFNKHDWVMYTHRE